MVVTEILCKIPGRVVFSGARRCRLEVCENRKIPFNIHVSIYLLDVFGMFYEHVKNATECSVLKQSTRTDGRTETDSDGARE